MKRTLVSMLLCCACGAAWAQAPLVIYKYRGTDGRMHYSDKPVRGSELIEAFEYTPPPAPPAIRPQASTSDAAGLERIKKHLGALETAWADVQESGRALAAAEELRAAGTAPGEGETQSLTGPSTPAPPSAGGPQPPAPPSAGGPMGNLRGGGRNAAYFERQARLEAAVEAARKRNQQAWERYNKLR